MKLVQPRKGLDYHERCVMKSNFFEGWNMTDFMPCPKHTESYPDCLVCIIEQRDDIIKKQQEIIHSFLAVYEAQEEGSVSIANQGQALDGYSALYNYNLLCSQIAYE